MIHYFNLHPSTNDAAHEADRLAGLLHQAMPHFSVLELTGMLSELQLRCASTKDLSHQLHRLLFELPVNDAVSLIKLRQGEYVQRSDREILTEKVGLAWQPEAIMEQSAVRRGLAEREIVINEFRRSALKPEHFHTADEVFPKEERVFTANGDLLALNDTALKSCAKTRLQLQAKPQMVGFDQDGTLILYSFRYEGDSAKAELAQRGFVGVSDYDSWRLHGMLLHASRIWSGLDQPGGSVKLCSVVLMRDDYAIYQRELPVDLQRIAALKDVVASVNDAIQNRQYRIGADKEMETDKAIVSLTEPATLSAEAKQVYAQFIALRASKDALEQDIADCHSALLRALDNCGVNMEQARDDGIKIELPMGAFSPRSGAKRLNEEALVEALAAQGVTINLDEFKVSGNASFSYYPSTKKLHKTQLSLFIDKAKAAVSPACLVVATDIAASLGLTTSTPTRDVEQKAEITSSFAGDCAA